MKRLLPAVAAAMAFGMLSHSLAKDLPCPNLQVMQVDWQGSEQEAMAAAKTSMAAASFKITGTSSFSVLGESSSPPVQGVIFTNARTASVTSLAIVAVASDPTEAMNHAQKLRSQMGKTPSAGREVKGSFSAIWVRDGGDDPAAQPKPWFRASSFTWHGPPDVAGNVAEQALHDLGFQNINGGGINPAHSGMKPAEQLTALVTYAPINETSARVHVMMAGYGPKAKIEGYCNDLKSILLYDTANLPAEKPGSSNTLASAVDQRVNKELQEGKLPGMAVAVLHGNKVAYIHGYGLAQGFDPDHTAKASVASVPVTEDTIFRWGSVIKTVAATTALRLTEEGKLNLESSVQTYIPTFPKKTDPQSKGTATITPRLLLCHQSGLPHYPDSAFLKADAGYKLNTNDSDPVDTLGDFEQSTLMFSPGTQTHYSSFGYMLLSAVIERAAGAQFVDVVNSEIIKPLGLSTLAVDRSKGLAAPGHAEGYTRNAEGQVIVRHAVDLAWKTGAGAYASNVKDLAHWAEALLQHKILQPGTYTMAWQPQPLPGGKSGLGLGFFLGKDGNGQLTVSHNGLADIATCQMTLYPGDGEGVVIMCNSVPGKNYGGPNVGKLANDIRDLAHIALTK